MAKASVPATRDEGGVPAYLQKYQNVENRDNFDQSDIVIPQIRLLQGTSKVIETFNSAKAGLFWHTGLDVPLGNAFNFVVASRRKKYLLVAPIEDGQGVLARADDSKTWNRTGEWDVKIKGLKKPVKWSIDDKDVIKSGLAEWGSSNPDDPDSPPAATLFYEYLVFLPDHLDWGPAVISLARSSIRKAKRGLNDKIDLHNKAGRPMQSIQFAAASVEDSADGQVFKNWVFTGNGFATEDVFKMALDAKDSLVNYVVQDEAETANEAEKTRGGKGPGKKPSDGEDEGEY